MINSDNSIQINIKFSFTVHEYIIAYKYKWILIYSITQFDIYMYIYILYNSKEIKKKLLHDIVLLT